MLGLWEHTENRPYGNPETYQIAVDWLSGHGTVEDWGCGTSWVKWFFPRNQPYLGIDGSEGFADVVEDLTARKGKCDSILLRHVLEHNFEWRVILRNALDSFQKRMVVVLFMSPSDIDEVASWEGKIPNIHICGKDFWEMIQPYVVRIKERGDEVCYLLEKHESQTSD